MKVHPIFSSFTTGEVSPLMYGRVDFAKFASGLRTLVNYIIRPHGPVYRRPGTHFVCEVKDSTSFTRLLKFEYNTLQAYQIEAGELYFRFLKDGGRIEVAISGAADNGAGKVRITASAHGFVTSQQVTIYGIVGTTEANGTALATVVDADTFDLLTVTFSNVYVSGGSAIPEAVTPYLSADLPLVKYVQNADTVYFVHPGYPPQKLVRNSHTSWTFQAINFLPMPTYEAGYTPAYTMTFGATTGLAVAITAGVGGDLLAADVGRLISIPGSTGRAVIKTVTAPTTGTVDIVDTLPSVGPFAASGGWLLQGSAVTALTPSGTTTAAHAIVTLTLAAAGWRATDVGLCVRVNHGVVRLTKFTSTTVVEGELLTVLVNNTASPAGSWSLESPQWSATRGYPRAIAFFEQRLVLAGYFTRAGSFQGSNVAFPEVYALGPDDDDAYDFTVATNEVNAINWLLPTRVLLIGTASSEFAAQGSAGATNAAISPNNIDVKPSTFWGSSETIQPLRIGNAGLFVSRPGTELREMIFSLQRDSYVADDMMLLSEHLTKGAGRTITDITYQRHPNSVVWCVLSDGTMLGLTYQREHDVVGWSRQTTGNDYPINTPPVKGKFESVVTTPHWNRDRDVTFVVVKRNINGAQKRFIEYLDDLSGYYGGLGMDCALTYTGVPTRSVSGMGHLVGEMVQVLGDGAVYPEQIVDANGVVTLPGTVPQFSRAEIGLGFNSMLQSMTVEVPMNGTSQGLKKHWAKILVRCYRTIGMFVNGEEKAFRSPDDLMDTAVPLFSGDIVHEADGRDDDTATSGVITVEQRQPLPQTITAIFGTLEVAP